MFVLDRVADLRSDSNVHSRHLFQYGRALPFVLGECPYGLSDNHLAALRQDVKGHYVGVVSSYSCLSALGPKSKRAHTNQTVRTKRCQL